MNDDRQSIGARNRALMPGLFDFADNLRDEFGEVRIVYAAKNGVELGKRPDSSHLTSRNCNELAIDGQPTKGKK